MKLSIIIPTRNRSQLLKGTLKSIAGQTFSENDYEVIVIDNDSTDDTKDVITSFQKNIKNLTYCFEKEPGLHVGRHRGMKEAQADILVYGDDDIEALPTWLEGIWESFQDEHVALVGGNNFPKYEAEPPSWLKDLWIHDENGDWLSHLSVLNFGDNSKEIDPVFVWGCNFSIRKSILLESGGFHPDSVPQEMIEYRGDGETYVSKFITEKGYKTVFNPRASVYHFVPKSRMTLEYLQRRVYNQGISDSFTNIRENGGIIEQNRGFIKAGKILTKKIYMNIRKKFSTRDSISNIDSLLRQSYGEGFAYHQARVRKDPDLLQWVLKENFF
ncbi:MAG: glycosyltransferase [bacterium]|nr:glycosyltransferase [bacterium]